MTYPPWDASGTPCPKHNLRRKENCLAGLAEHLYKRSPLWGRKALLNAYALRLHRRRYGPGFQQALNAVLSRESWDMEKMNEYRRGRLAGHLNAALRTEYWKGVFEEHGVAIGPESDPFETLNQLPLLDKETVKANVDEIRDRSIPDKSLIPRQTSGTTGSGLKFVETRGCEHETWAVWWRYRMRLGIGLHQRCGYFGGRTIIPPDRQQPPFWLYNRVWNQVLFSAYHLGPGTAGSYANAIRDFGLKWLHGYPSTIALLAGLMKDAGFAPVDIVENITFGAESLSPRQRAVVQEMFPANRLSEHYGLAEGVANISECEKGVLHVDEDFSLVEFVEVPGNPEVREIVGTNWSNPVFPLLRYRTGDLARLGQGDCACGRQSRTVEEIHGRREDAIELPGGAVVGRLDHIFKDMTNINEAQIHQYSPDRIEVLIVKSRRYTDRDEAALLRNFQERIGKAPSLKFRYVSSLDRDQSGKLKFVVSHMGTSNAQSGNSLQQSQ